MLQLPAPQPKWQQLPGVRAVAPLLPLFAALGLAASVLDGASISLLIPLLSLLISGDISNAIPAPLQFLVRFAGLNAGVLAGIIIALVVVKGLVQAASDWLATAVEGTIGRKVRLALTDALLGLEYPFFFQPVAPRLTNIITTQTWAVLDAVHSALALIPAVAALLVFTSLLAWLNFKLFLIVLVGAAVIESTLYVVKRRQERLSNAFPDRFRYLLERLITLVQAPRVIRLFGQQHSERQRTERAIDELRDNLVSSQRLKAFADPLLDAMMTLLLLVVLLVGYRSGMPIPSIAAFVLVLSRAQPHARKISTARLNLASLRGSISEVQWLLSQPIVPTEAFGDSSTFRLDQPICFDAVSFRYPNGNAALDRATFSIEPGSVTALIGESGSGKTTVVNLLCRLIEPGSGTIRLGKSPAAEFPAAHWRRRIAVAGQDTELVSGTVAENIGYGKPEATMSEIEAAARAAGADIFVRALPNGYETHVGTQGLSLSGGQRQRIALARALLTYPDLLVLDEATNAVDAITEAEIMRLIAEHRFFKTLIVISHRKTTLGMCENGIVLAGGRIVETGPLKNLAYFKQIDGAAEEPASSE